MSLISGLLTMPYEYAYFAYEASHHNFFTNDFLYQQNINHGLSIIGYHPKVDKSDPNFREKLPGDYIRLKMHSFLSQIGIREDVIFFERKNRLFCAAQGTNMFKKSDAVIIIQPNLYKLDKDLCTFFIKHEISHIKNNDVFTIQLIPLICKLAASIFGMCYLSFLPAVGLAIIVSYVSHSLFSKWREAKADDFAIKYSSDEELKKAYIFLKAVKEINIEKKSTVSRLLYSDSGEFRLDFVHPSFKSRIKKIENVLHDKKIKIDMEMETVLIANFKKYLKSEEATIGSYYL